MTINPLGKEAPGLETVTEVRRGESLGDEWLLADEMDLEIFAAPKEGTVPLHLALAAAPDIAEAGATILAPLQSAFREMLLVLFIGNTLEGKRNDIFGPASSPNFLIKDDGIRPEITKRKKALQKALSKQKGVREINFLSNTK